MTTPTLTTIHLVGSLGKAIGHTKLTLDVTSVAEAIRAIDVITKGKIRAYLGGPAKDRYYKVAIQKKDNLLGQEEIGHRCGYTDIWIMPTIRGRDKAWKKVLAGVVLLAAAFFLPASITGYALFGTKVTVGSLLVTYGIALTLGGIAQALTPGAKAAEGPSVDDRASKIFQGNSIAAAQGIPVPIIYGRALVSPVPISISMSNNDLYVTNAGTVGTVDQTDLEGGGVQYEPGTEDFD